MSRCNSEYSAGLPGRAERQWDDPLEADPCRSKPNANLGIRGNP